MMKTWKNTAFYGMMLAVSIAAAAHAGEFTAKVVDSKNKAVADAVVYLIPEKSRAPGVEKGKKAVMDQVDKQFKPRVLVVQTGTSVDFPNSDEILHHVYSFSAAKTFELPLYKDKPAAPVVFDKPGVAALGCNVHDWMIGYVVVVDTPWFAKTGKDGKISIKDAPPGDYKAFIWHSDSTAKNQLTSKNVKIEKGKAKEVKFNVKLKRKNKKKKAPDPSGGMNY